MRDITRVVCDDSAVFSATMSSLGNRVADRMVRELGESEVDPDYEVVSPGLTFGPGSPRWFVLVTGWFVLRASIMGAPDS